MENPSCSKLDFPHPSLAIAVAVAVALPNPALGRPCLAFIIVRFCTWGAYICQSVLLTLICQLALRWSHGHGARWSSGCPMQVASAVSACPSMPLQQNQPAASCLFPNFASHRRPTCVSCRKKQILFWLSVSSVPNAMVPVHCCISIYIQLAQ